MSEIIETDVAIVGAGPVGLFAVFELGMLKLRCVLIDALGETGGQCTALYPEKPIYDIPAHPAIEAAELINQLEAQIRPFPTPRLLGRRVEALEGTSGAFNLRTDQGDTVHAKAVILAAGRSTRMAPHNKLLVPDRAGKPMIARVVDNVLASGIRPVLVVTGHLEAEIRAAIGGRPVTFVHAARHAEGLAESLKAGIAALPADTAAALVCLGDMPLVTGRMIERIAGVWDPDEGRAIVVPTHQGQPGNPILWDRRFFPDILALSGDSGAKSLLRRHMELVAEIDIADDAVLRDFDTPETAAARAHPMIWRAMRATDLDAADILADQTYPDHYERPGIMAERLSLAPDGCFVLADGEALAGYLVSHPWAGPPPPLDSFLGSLPA
eukprot:gene35479-47705_t